MSFLPGLGFILTILFSFMPRNKNLKNFERAILAYYIIGIILALIAVIVFFAILPAGSQAEVATGLQNVIGSFS
jgi:uncharacterized membrane protein